MVKIGVTLGKEDQSVPDNIIEAVGGDIAKSIGNALNKTNNPDLAMIMLEEKLSELHNEMMLEYKRAGILK